MIDICGIVAEHAATVPDADACNRMLGRLKHRGPDDEGHIRVGRSWLGHRRLSIVDVAGGRQPLSGDGLYLVGNGEIYNHDELRRDLEGSRFATRSDNESALHLVDRHGPAALSRLRGMFAFCLAGEGSSFVAARDPVGIKPLYWARKDGSTRFASEMKAFDADWRAAVEVFPPGHYWTPEAGLVRFASVQRATHGPTSDDAHPAGPDPTPTMLRTLRRTLTGAIERRMMADVPVGVFLSGGLDSSLVAAVAAAHARRRGQRLQTFSVGLAGSPDLAAARVVARHLDVDHYERVYTADEAVAAVPDVIAAVESYEPSLVRSAVPNFFLAELAAEHVKVVLTGEGADELFAGYEYLRGMGGNALRDELVRIVEGLHNLNLQRCDRVAMAHGLEARVPFLDLDVIGLGLALPVAWKLSAPDRMEKHLLRSAFADSLPDEILWRKKAQFGDGSGATAALQDRMAATVTDAELARAQAAGAANPPRSREELAYLRLFRQRLGGVRPDRVLGRFATA